MKGSCRENNFAGPTRHRHLSQLRPGRAYIDIKRFVGNQVATTTEVLEEYVAVVQGAILATNTQLNLEEMIAGGYYSPVLKLDFD